MISKVKSNGKLSGHGSRASSLVPMGARSIGYRAITLAAMHEIFWMAALVDVREDAPLGEDFNRYSEEQQNGVRPAICAILSGEQAMFRGHSGGPTAACSKS